MTIPPDISVVIPTYRRPELLDRCLAALNRQDLRGGRFEVIIADDAASAETERQILKWRPLFEAVGADLRYVAVRGGHGPARARNLGWRAARAEIVAFTDDDCIPSARWLRAGLAAFSDGAGAAWGRLSMPLPPVATDYELNASALASAEFVTANCFCRRSMLEEVGGFDERFTAAWREDSDLFFCLLKKNCRIVHAPDALVEHPIRPAPWGISLRQQKKSMFEALLYKKHPDFYRLKIRPSTPVGYYIHLLLAAAAAVAWLADRPGWATVFAAGWFLSIVRFSLGRLRGTSRAPSHVAEMFFTSCFIPPLSVFFRLRGALKYRVFFL